MSIFDAVRMAPRTYGVGGSALQPLLSSGLMMDKSRFDPGSAPDYNPDYPQYQPRTPYIPSYYPPQYQYPSNQDLGAGDDILAELAQFLARADATVINLKTIWSPPPPPSPWRRIPSY